MELRKAHYWVWSWDSGWGVLPLAAVLGGAWAFADPFQTGHWPTLALAAALVLVGWGPLWYAILTTDWATPLGHWRAWDTALPVRPLPYTRPGTPGARLHQRVEQARAWWQAVGATHLAVPLRSATLALVASLLLSVVQGRDTLLLTLLFLTCAQLAVLWCEGRGHCTPGWEGLALVGLPWLLGAASGTEILLLPTVSGIVLALLVGTYGQPTLASLIGPLAATGFLIWMGEPFVAGVPLLLALPGFLLLLQRPPADTYRRAVGPWLLAMILLMAWAL